MEVIFGFGVDTQTISLGTHAERNILISYSRGPIVGLDDAGESLPTQHIP